MAAARPGQILEAAAGNPHLPLFQAYLALLSCESDRPDDARDRYERLAGTDFSGLPMDNTWMPTVATSVLACARLGDGPGASVLHGTLLPYADQFVFLSGGAWGAVTHHLGLLATTLGHFDEAEARFVAAAETHERIGALPCSRAPASNGPACFSLAAGPKTPSRLGISSSRRSSPQSTSASPP